MTNSNALLQSIGAEPGATYTLTFDRLPESLAELKALPQADLSRPWDTAALTVAALCAYPKDREETYAMLDFLRGPRPLSPMEKQFIRDRFMDGKGYIPRSYFEGAVPGNDYTPGQPLTLKLRVDPHGIAEETYLAVYLNSGGADSPRAVRLRCKPSTGQWFLWEQYLLSGIRIPQSQDEWA